MSRIEHISAREVLDSRGNPTLQATVAVAGGFVGKASVPSGASTGQDEALELRDKDESRYGGKGVLTAVAHVNTEIHAALLGKSADNQTRIDRIMLELDGTPNKSRLGANAILGVSMACARAEAAAQNLPLFLYLEQLYPARKHVLPVPQMNLINGGAHAQNNLAIQEFQILPIGSTSFSEALRMGAEIYHALQGVLVEAGIPVGLGDEGGYAGGETEHLDQTEEAFTYMVRAIEIAGYVPGVDAFLGIDAAANEFYDAESQLYRLDGKGYAEKDLAHVYQTWRERYPLISIEDPFQEDAWDAWCNFTKRNGEAVQIVGDDLYVTNPARIKEGIMRGAANAVLIKLNQIGTLSETLEAILVAQEAGHNAIISHRSGETEDTFIADLAVATGAGQIKTGAPARSERVAKYNRLLEIEGEIKEDLAHVLDGYLENVRPNYASAGELKVTNSRRM